MPVVDSHVHLFKALTDKYPRVIFEGMAPPEREELVEQFLAVMEANGVDHAVIVPLSPHDRYLAEILTRYPGKFAGVGVYDFDVDDPVSDLERRIEQVRIQGVRLYGLGAEPGSEAEEMRVLPLLTAMRDHDVKLWFYGPLDQVVMLDKALELLPGLKVVMNHLAFSPNLHVEMRIDEDRRPRFNEDLPPRSLQLIERIADKHSTVYVHVSGQYAFTGEPYPYRDLQEVVDRVYAAFGADRMLMASDWPWSRENPGYAEVLKLVDSYLPDLTAEERAAIRGGTAMSLFEF